MTSSSNINRITSPSGSIQCGTIAFNYAPNTIPSVTITFTTPNLPNIDTGLRTWFWQSIYYQYVSGEFNIYQPGVNTYRNFYTNGNGISALPPQELLDLIDRQSLNNQTSGTALLNISWTSTLLDIQVNDINKPNYISLLSGYELDTRTIPDYPTIIPTEAKSITISYYRENKLEPIENLRSIDWMMYECNLISGTPYTLPIKDCVLGTLHSSDSTILIQLSQLPVLANKYLWSDLLPEAIPSLFSGWYQIYDAQNIDPLNRPIFPEERRLTKIAANNNIWNNANLSNNLDINFDINHPMFAIDNTRAYNWHIAQQNNNGIGTLIMDSPRTIEIHAALDASKWAVNPEDPTLPRVDNLGWRINRGNEVLGIRVKPDGTIDEELEKTTNRRLHAEGSEQNDEQDYNPNCFGKKGMLVRHLPN
ncbi:MAG: hypothetical protein ACRC80_29890, partial [Waterburya sp.]